MNGKFLKGELPELNIRGVGMRNIRKKCNEKPEGMHRDTDVLSIKKTWGQAENISQRPQSVILDD